MIFFVFTCWVKIQKVNNKPSISKRKKQKNMNTNTWPNIVSYNIYTLTKIKSVQSREPLYGEINSICTSIYTNINLD
jgi:hypothetical protein